MIRTIKIKLRTTATQHAVLLATMRRFNEACDFISKEAFESRIFGKVGLQKLTYSEIRSQFGLSSQMAVRAIGKVNESYKLDKKTQRKFRLNGAMVYDQRILSFKDSKEASILTLEGRIKVPMVFGDVHKKILEIEGCRICGQSDLIFQKNQFYLMLAIEIPDIKTQQNEEYLGVDLGIVNIAVDSEKEVFSGKAVNNVRCRRVRLRKKLQRKGTKSAKRKLKKLSGKEKRFARDVNHCISKKIVKKAKALGTGIALEDLKGIRKRTEKTVRKQQRYRHSSWAFYQLRQFIEYKAEAAGIPVESVDPRNTSRTCPICGCIDKKNRKVQDKFVCIRCGYAAMADIVAATIIRSRAVCQSANRRLVKQDLQAPSL